MHVILADTAVTIQGWPAYMDSIGEYSLKVRKTPEEVKAERDRYTALYGKAKKTVQQIKFIPKTVLYHDDNDRSTVYFLPGLWPRVKARLEQEHIEYTIEDKRDPSIRPDIDYSKLTGVQFRENQDIALALIAKADCGIIETCTSWGKSMLISVVCKSLTSIRILVCTSSASVVGTLCEYLAKQMPGEVGYVYGKGNTAQGKRVVVSTLKSLDKIPTEWPQLILVDECHDCGDGSYGQSLMRFCFARRFGFSASPVRNDGSGLFLESLLGPTILKMTYDEAVDAGMVTPMKYTMLHCGSGPSICQKEGLQEVVMKRFAYWANTARNKAIQRFIYDLKKVSDCQVLIMVATMEAAIHLNMLLPWFKVACYGAVDKATLSKHFPKERYPNLDLDKYKMTQKQLDIMRNAFAKGTLRYVISTTVFRQGVNFPHLQVLVRADGATSAVMGIQIPGRLARLDDNKDYAYLVDIDDTFCPWARRRANARETLYKQQQWIEATREEVLSDLRAKCAVNTDDSAGTGISEECETCDSSDQSQ